MKNFDSVGLRVFNGKVLVLDQQALPDEERWLECTCPDEMVTMIRVLKVRGAPLIGVAAAVALATFAERERSNSKVLAAAQALRGSRPTAVNLMNAIDRAVAAFAEGGTQALVAEAEHIFAEDIALCDRIAEHGASLIKDGDGILTHCNAGALATAGVGTAVGVIHRAFEQGKRIHVFVDETRPLLQGARLTAWELKKAGIPHTLICDNMAAAVMASGKINRVFVGADRIAVNGDFANKIGTYGVAVAAKYHGIPLYVAAPYTTVDARCASGSAIPIEQRAMDEVRGALGNFGQVCWAPEGVQTFNPAFDVTPGTLVEAFILDTGVVSRAEVAAGALGRFKVHSR